jgi:hypothetical protein
MPNETHFSTSASSQKTTITNSAPTCEIQYMRVAFLTRPKWKGICMDTYVSCFACQIAFIVISRSIQLDLRANSCRTI